MFTKKFIPIVFAAAALLAANGVTYAADEAAAETEAAAVDATEILAKCKKEFGEDQAKVDECVAVNGDVSKMESGEEVQE